MKDKNKLVIECECADRHGLITLEYLDNFDEFCLNFYRLYHFKRKKELGEVIIGKDQAKEMINFMIRNCS